MPLTTGYYEEYLEAIRTHWWFRGRERVLEAVVSPLIPLTDEALVADVGSGPGGPARALFPRGYLIAMDVSPTPLQAYASASARVAADAVRLPCQSGRLDVVCAFDVLEHLDDDAAALREWKRLLIPDGWLVITVPAYQLLWSAHDDVNGHRRRYRAGPLKRLLTAAGFRAIRLTYFNTLLLPGVAAVRWAGRLFSAGSPKSASSLNGHLDCRLRFPAWIERSCEEALKLEARWLRRGNLGMGVSICAIARKET